jgi:hypothetical protein
VTVLVDFFKRENPQALFPQCSSGNRWRFPVQRSLNRLFIGVKRTIHKNSHEKGGLISGNEKQHFGHCTVPDLKSNPKCYSEAVLRGIKFLSISFGNWLSVDEHRRNFHSIPFVKELVKKLKRRWILDLVPFPRQGIPFFQNFANSSHELIVRRKTILQ